MLDATGHDQKFPRRHHDLAVAKAHAEPPVDHEEQLILVLVMMPDELSRQPGELDLHVVDLTRDPRLPGLGESGECLAKIDLVHGRKLRDPGRGCAAIPPGRPTPPGARLQEPYRPRPLGVKRILFVDDEPNLLDGLKRSLRGQRAVWDITFASSGHAALERLGEGGFDVVVSDMRMPSMDGAALLDAVRERDPAAMRIVLSGFTDLDSSIRAAPAAHRLLLKPCDPVVLRQVIERHIAMRDRLPDPSIARLVGSVRAVPVAPAAYRLLRDRSAPPPRSVESLAEVVAGDVGLSAKVLQLTNSAFLGRAQEVADIRTAVACLGGSIVARFTLTADPGQPTICYPFEPDAPSPGFVMDDFQRHCTLTAAIASRLAVDGCTPGVLFTAGLLHDIGKLVIAERAVSRRVSGDSGWGDANSVHADVGAYLLGLWGLPEVLVEAVAHHHRPEAAPAQARSLAAAVCLADWLAHHPDGSRAAAPELGALDVTLLAALGGLARMPAWQAMAAEVRASGRGGL